MSLLSFPRLVEILDQNVVLTSLNVPLEYVSTPKRMVMAQVLDLDFTQARGRSDDEPNMLRIYTRQSSTQCAFGNKSAGR